MEEYKSSDKMRRGEEVWIEMWRREMKKREELKARKIVFFKYR